MWAVDAAIRKLEMPWSMLDDIASTVNLIKNHEQELSTVLEYD